VVLLDGHRRVEAPADRVDDKRRVGGRALQLEDGVGLEATPRPVVVQQHAGRVGATLLEEEVDILGLGIDRVEHVHVVFVLLDGSLPGLVVTLEVTGYRVVLVEPVVDAADELSAVVVLVAAEVHHSHVQRRQLGGLHVELVVDYLRASEVAGVGDCRTDRYLPAGVDLVRCREVGHVEERRARLDHLDDRTHLVERQRDAVTVDAGRQVDRNLVPECHLGRLAGVEAELHRVLDNPVEDVLCFLCRRLGADVFECRRHGHRLALVGGVGQVQVDDVDLLVGRNLDRRGCEVVVAAHAVGHRPGILLLDGVLEADRRFLAGVEL